MQYNPYGTGKIAIGAYGQPTKSDTPRGSGGINISGSGAVKQYIPFGTCEIGISGLGEPYRYPEKGTGEITIGGYGTARYRTLMPPDIGCIITDGYIQQLSKGVACLSNSSNFNNARANVNFISLNNQDMNDFYYWWLNTLEYGEKQFAVLLPFMGITRLWEARITNDFVTSMESAYIRKIPLELEILDDFIPYLPETSYGYEYPEEVGCIIVTGYTEASKKVTRCLGGGMKSPTESMTGTIMIETNELFAKFMDWYVNQLGYGNESFTVSLPFMGTSGLWKAEFKELPTFSLNELGATEVKIELNLLDYSPIQPIV